jgi:glutamine cyclotransferase
VHKINLSTFTLDQTLLLPCECSYSRPQNSITLLHNGYLWLIGWSDHLCYIYKINTSNFTYNTYRVPNGRAMTLKDNFLYISASDTTNSKILKYDISSGFEYVSEWDYYNTFSHSIINDGRYLYMCSWVPEGIAILKKAIF